MYLNSVHQDSVQDSTGPSIAAAESAYCTVRLELALKCVKLKDFEQSIVILEELQSTSLCKKAASLLVDIWIFLFKLTSEETYLVHLKRFEHVSEEQASGIYFLILIHCLKTGLRFDEVNVELESALSRKFHLPILQIRYLADLFDALPEEKAFFDFSKKLARIVCIMIDGVFEEIEWIHQTAEIQNFKIEKLDAELGTENHVLTSISPQFCLNEYKMFKFFVVDTLFCDPLEKENIIAMLGVFKNNINKLKSTKALDQDIVTTYLYEARMYLEELK